jgi:integrative and conjugative element protein (TIGR02256 family)
MRYPALRYIVSHKALETIEWECRKYPDTETGGILVGYKDAGQVTVTHATGSGPKAERSAHHFTKDTPYLQSVLNLLGHYYQVDYLGVWHKHPQAMPFPSGGDILSAMEEVRDQDMMLEELLTPICLLDEGKVDILPFIIREDRFQSIHWESVPHDGLMPQSPDSQPWYATAEGRNRLNLEIAEFKAAGVAVDVRRGSDETYRFYVPLGDQSRLRLVMLCPEDYPVTGPDVALYDESSQKYEPVNSRILDEWNIYQHLVDLFREYQAFSESGKASP